MYTACCLRGAEAPGGSWEIMSSVMSWGASLGSESFHNSVNVWRLAELISKPHKASIAVKASVITMSGKIISREESLLYFYNNQPNRKQLSRFWLSQCFSTGETIPDIMLFWMLESRGATKTPHMIQRVCRQLKAPEKTNTNLFSDPNLLVQYKGVCSWYLTLLL